MLYIEMELVYWNTLMLSYTLRTTIESYIGVIFGNDYVFVESYQLRIGLRVTRDWKRLE